MLCLFILCIFSSNLQIITIETPYQVKEEEENAMHNTVVIFSSNDSFTLKQVFVYLILACCWCILFGLLIHENLNSLKWPEFKSVLKDLSHWRSLILVEIQLTACRKCSWLCNTGSYLNFIVYYFLPSKSCSCVEFSTVKKCVTDGCQMFIRSSETAVTMKLTLWDSNLEAEILYC